MSLPSYTVWFRGKPACPCLAAWLPVFEAELIRRNVVRESIDIAQLIGSAEASANTHATGGAFDIWQHDDVTVWVARQMGADATWARTTGSFVNNRHAHGVLRGCEHNSAARYQLDEVDDGGDGLIGSTPDPGPRPLSGRTWRQGIAWALEQQEDVMATKAELAELLDTKLAPLEQLLRGSRERERQGRTKLNEATRRLERLEAEAKDDATKAQVRAARADITELGALLAPEPGEDVDA